VTPRKRPAPTDRPSPNATNGYHQRSGDYRHQPPTADERREAKLLEELHGLGYGITVPCLICGHALTSVRSLARHVGPQCLAKVVSE
jgi:hypothetical protein